jgi:hypothetical protein
MNSTKIISLFFSIFLLHSLLVAQEGGYIEINGGILRYSSTQNNWDINPAFGVSLNRQLTPGFGGELFLSGAAINETVTYSSKFGPTTVKNERFVASWVGFRFLFGKNTETWSFNGLSGFSLRTDKSLIALELGIKHTHQLFGSFWIHTTASIMVDNYKMRYGDEPYYSAPLDVSLFGNVKLGLAYHFK